MENHTEISDILNLLKKHKLEYTIDKDNHVLFFDIARIYMIKDKNPDYTERMALLEKNDIIEGHFREPQIVKNGYSDFDIYLNNIKSIGKQIYFLVGCINNTNVVSGLKTDPLDNDEYVAKVLEEGIGKENKYTILDGEIMVNVISAMSFFIKNRYERINVMYSEDMPLIMETERLKIYVAPKMMDIGDKLRMENAIKKSIENSHSSSVYETEE